jgi:hypothetical protein
LGIDVDEPLRFFVAKLAGEWDAIAAVLEREPTARKQTLTNVASTGSTCRETRLRVLDGSFRCLVPVLVGWPGGTGVPSGGHPPCCV